jgi:hypothetical protein
VPATPIEKAAFELNAKVKCKSSPKTGTGVYGSRYSTAKNLVSWSKNTTRTAKLKSRVVFLSFEVEFRFFN